MSLKTCLLILGMHRSGTSALAGLLKLSGVELGRKLLPPAPDNPKGFFENEEITSFNEFVLLPALNSSWDDVSPLNFNAFKNLEKFKSQAMEIIENNFSKSRICAIKDPRLCILFPFWESVLKNLRYRIKVIIPVRHPTEVALSLEKRNKFLIEKGLLLWTKYLLYSEYFSRKYKRVFVKYEDLIRQPCEIIEYIQSKLKIKFPENCKQIKDIRDFIEPSLKHFNIQELPEYTPEFIKNLVNEAFYKRKKSPKNFDKFREQYINYFNFFDNIFGRQRKKVSLNYIKQNINTWFDTFIVDIVNLSLLNEKIGISGIACLKRPYNFKEFDLYLKGGFNQEVKISWGHPSPVYAQRNPSNPNAKNARFVVEIPPKKEPISIVLRNIKNSNHEEIILCKIKLF